MKFSKILFSLLLATIMAAPIVATSAEYTRTSTIQSVNTFTPTTGSTVTLTRANQVNAALTPATDLASLTIALPTSPKDGDAVTITSSKNINSVTFTGGTTSGAPASMSAGGGVSFVYTASNTTWSLANGSSTPLASLTQGASVTTGDLFLTRQNGDTQDKKVQSELLQRYVLRGYLIDPRDPKYGSNTCTGYYNIASSSVNSGGSGYAVNDTFSITNPSLKGGGTPAYGKVTAVDGSGAVTAYTLTAAGGGFVTVTGRSTTTMTGSGSGLTIDITSIGTGNDDTAAFVAAATDGAAQGAAVIVPHGCWVQNMTLPQGATLVGSGWGPTYGYDKTQLPLMYLIGTPTYGIKNSNRGITLIGFEVNATYNSAASGQTTCIGTSAGNTGGGGFGEKTVLHFMSMKGCIVGYGNYQGGTFTGSLMFTDASYSDFGGNQYGIAGPISDLHVDHSVFVSGDYGIYLSPSAGGYAIISNNRLEYLNKDAIKLSNGGGFQNTLISNQIDRAGRACVNLSGAEQTDITGGQMKSCGSDGSFTVVGAADNGSGAIRLTITSRYPGPHSSSCTTTCYTNGMSTGDVAQITGVLGTTEANGTWTITVVDGNHIDLQSSTFANAYTSGGFGGVRGKAADIQMSGTVKNLTVSNVIFSGTSGGAVYTPSWVVEAASGGTYDRIRFNGIANNSNSYADAGYTMAFANWVGGTPTNLTIDMLGYGRFDNRNQLSINANGDIGIGTTSANASTALDLMSKTSSIGVPKGTTAQQPTAAEGLFRYNTTTHAFEFAMGSTPTWQTFNPVSTTWPTSGAIVVSNGTNSPAGLTPSDGQCVVGSGGAWIAGSCSGVSSTVIGTSTSSTSPQRSGEANTGFYTTASGQVGIAGLGSSIASWTSSGMDLAAPAITYSGGTNFIKFPTNDSNVGASVAIGSGALSGMTGSSAAYQNIAIGYQALNGTMTTAALNNMGLGYQACKAVTTGNTNICIGAQSGSAITTGQQNTFIGFGAGKTTAVGVTGIVAIGPNAAQNASNASSYATAIGYNAAQYLGSGASDVAIGREAGRGSSGSSRSGSGNTYVGAFSGTVSQGASAANTMIGFEAGKTVTTGSNNTIIGYQVGNATLTTGSSNIMIGTSSSVAAAASGTSNYLTIGNLLKGDLSKVHRYFGGSSPAVSSCGTSPTIDANATDSSGMVTAGATATSCTITFNQAYTSFNHCMVTTQAAKSDLAYSYTTSAITVTSATLGGVNIDYRCDGN